MSFELLGQDITMPQGGDLTANQFLFVKLNSSGQVVAMAAATDIPFGIQQDVPRTSTTGLAVTVRMFGVSKCVGNGSVTAGNQIEPDSTGKAAPGVNGTDTTHYIVGQALETSTVSGELVAVAFNCLNPGRGA